MGSITDLGDTYEEIMENWLYLTREEGLCVRVLDIPVPDFKGKVDGDEEKILDLILRLVIYRKEQLHSFEIG